MADVPAVLFAEVARWLDDVVIEDLHEPLTTVHLSAKIPSELLPDLLRVIANVAEV